MKEIIITSSVLILGIILIRIIFKGRIGGRLQYALWLLVALRLIVPSSAQIHMAIGSIEWFRVMDLVMDLEGRFGHVTEQLEKPVQFHMSLDGPLGEQMAAFMLGEELDLPSEDGPTSVFVAGKVGGLIWLDIVRGIWIGGMIAAALWVIITNIVFTRKLHKGRKEFALPEELAYLCTGSGKPQKAEGHRHRAKQNVRLYTTDYLTSSCLYGLPGREAIYLTPDIAADASKLRHVVTHEMCHRRHGDSFWSILRSVLLCVYWMNPLVWVAAVLSKRDCELACDEAALRILGEEERISYGETLLSIITGKSRLSDIACTATTMHGSGRSIKERIRYIAEKPKVLGVAVAAALVLVVAVSVLVFTRAPLLIGYVWKGEITLTAGDMQVRLPETIAGISSYDVTEDGGEIIVYQKSSGREAGRFCALSRDEAAAFAGEGRKVIPAGSYGAAGIPGMDGNDDDTTYIIDDSSSAPTAAVEKSRDYLPNEQITVMDIHPDAESGAVHNDTPTPDSVTVTYTPSSDSVTVHTYTPAGNPTEGMIAHEDRFIPEGAASTEGVPGTDSNDDDTTYVYEDTVSTAEPAEESRDYLPDEKITEAAVDYLPNEQITEGSGNNLPGEETEGITIYDGTSVTRHNYTSAEPLTDQYYVYVQADYAGVKKKYLDEMEYINSELEAAAERAIVTSINRKIRGDMFAALAGYRTAYLGDASKVSALISALPQPEGFTYRGMLLHTLETEPETALSLEINYEVPEQGMTDADTDLLFFNAAMLFATIGNMDECRFILMQVDNIPQNDAGESAETAEEQQEEAYEKVTYDRDGLQTTLGTTLWSAEAAESTDAYMQWLEELYADIVKYLRS